MMTGDNTEPWEVGEKCFFHDPEPLEEKLLVTCPINIYSPLLVTATQFLPSGNVSISKTRAHTHPFS